MKSAAVAVLASLAAAAAVQAAPTLQFDLNGFHAQAADSGGVASPFGGLTHTGSLQFSVGSGQLNGVFIQSLPYGPFVNAGLSGYTLSGFSGQIDMVNGQVTGGSIAITLSNADVYTCQMTPGSGAVLNYIGGGYKIEALTRGGVFSDSQFGNVDVTQWFAAQGGGGLAGSFLEFNFQPDGRGAASSDMDLFVQTVPLPAGVWGGLAVMGGIAIRRRGSARRI